MRIQISASLALLTATANAFKDTSPFFLFSTSSSFSELPSPNIAHSSTITSHLLTTLSSCPSDAYIIVSQPAVSAADFSHGAGIPHLKNALNNTHASIRASVTVPEVVGSVDLGRVLHLLESKCEVRIVHAYATTGDIPNETANPRIVMVDFEVLPTDQKARISKLSDHDSFLHAVLSTVGGKSYTVLYLTSPPSAEQAPITPVYEMDDSQAAIHQEFKRDVSAHARASNESNSNAPLFEKYVFTSPAIFMGLFATILLLLIVYTGISALGSLQVSYFAFSKEMGPAAQKKQQ